MRTATINEAQTLSVRAREAAKLLGISERTLWALTKAHQIPHVRVGRNVLYPIDELRNWLAEKANQNGSGCADRSQER